MWLRHMCQRRVDWKGDMDEQSYWKVEVDRGRMVWELLARSSMEKYGGQEDVIHAGSWSRHR